MTNTYVRVPGMITSDPFRKIPWDDLGPHEVIITKADRLRAEEIENARFAYNRASRIGRGFHGEDQHQGAVMGALGEVVASIYFNIPLNEQLGDFDAPDVGKMIEVKTIDCPDHCLILKNTKNVHPSNPYVLVYLFGDRARLMGWLMGHEIMHDRFWRDGPNIPSPAWFVPQSALRPMDEWKWGVFH